MAAQAPPLPPPDIPPIPPPSLLPPPIGIPPYRPLAPPPLRQTALPPSNVVLLTGIPQQLHQTLANWILPCGPARTILWYPKQLEKEDNMDKSKKSMALVTMMHGDGAWKLVHTITTIPGQLGDLKAHLVPASPDILLPPIILDDSIAVPLQQAMKKSFDAILAGTFDQMSTPPQSQQQPLLETHKVAAAAGGHNYDEDADPLNAPAVLQAVREFRASLHKTSAAQQARRISLVQERLDKAMAVLRNPPAPPVPGAPSTGIPPLEGLAPPLPPPPPPPLPGSALDSGMRGQSNLPAWMTATGDLGQLPLPPQHPQSLSTSVMLEEQQQQQPAAKKIKLSSIATIDESLLRAHVAKQITHYMGVEEATLIDFCVNHVMSLTAAQSNTEQATISSGSKVPMTWDGLAQELQQVLEEDTAAFVEDLQNKVKELSRE